MNPKYTSKLHSLVTMLRWQISRKLEKRPQFFSSLSVHTKEVFPKENCLVWHGHATVSLQFDQQHIIIDPVLQNIPFYKRFTQLPLNIQEIVPNILLLTHAHYDHFHRDGNGHAHKNKSCLKTIFA